MFGTYRPTHLSALRELSYSTNGLEPFAGSISEGEHLKQVVIGPGLIGQAIARHIGVCKHILLAELRKGNADSAAEILSNAGYEVGSVAIGADGGFNTGSDFLMDCGITAAFWFGELAQPSS